MLSINPGNYRYFVEFAYNGTRYHGWQFQPNAISVQEDMNKAFSKILKQDINLLGAGRTDTGVHASHFVAHFDLADEPQDIENIIFKLNRFLSHDIRIDRICRVPDNLHARFSAKSRTYKYIISREKSAFMHDFSWNIWFKMDYELMQEASRILLDYSDFTSFARLHTDTKTNLCEIRIAEWNKEDNFWIFTIQADRFLRNMVRSVVGTLVDIGCGKLTKDEFRKIIEAKDRSLAGQSAPPQGLFLAHIDYAEKFPTSPKPPFALFF